MRIHARTIKGAEIIIEGVAEFDFDSSNEQFVFSLHPSRAQRNMRDIKFVRVVTDDGGHLFEWKRPLSGHEIIADAISKRSVTMPMQQTDPMKRVSTSDVQLTLTEEGAECLYAMLFSYLRGPMHNENPLKSTYHFLQRAFSDLTEELVEKHKDFIG